MKNGLIAEFKTDTVNVSLVGYGLADVFRVYINGAYEASAHNIHEAIEEFNYATSRALCDIAFGAVSAE